MACEKQIVQLLHQLKEKGGFVIAHDIDYLAKSLAAGHAVDSIFHQRGNTLTELRVWSEDVHLVSREQGVIASL